MPHPSARHLAPTPRRTGRLLVGVAAAVGLAMAALVPTLATAASPASAVPLTLWGERPNAKPVVDSDTGAVELGTAFTTRTAGTVMGVRFWKTAENTGTHVGHLWGPGGKLLASAIFTGESASAWQTVRFSSPVSITASTRYVVSYYAPKGRYVSTVGYHGTSHSRTLLVTRGKSGVYSYGSSATYPDSSWRSSQYWVDVLFVPGGGSAPGSGGAPAPQLSSTPTPTPTLTPTPTPTSPAPTPTPTPTPPVTPPSTPTPGSNVASVAKGWNLKASSVGLAPFGLACASLPEYKLPGNTVPAGTTIYRQRITGWLDLSQGNITISQSCIQPKPGYVGQGTASLTTWGTRDLAGPVTIQDSEYDGSLLSQHDQAWVILLQGAASLYRNYIHNSGSGIAFQGADEKTNTPVVVQNNYVDHLVAYGDAATDGNHQSAFTVRDFTGRTMLVRDNYFNCDGASATGGFFIQPNGGNVSNITATGNLIAGNGYNMYVQADPSRFGGVSYSNISATDNRFRPTEYGPSVVRGGPGWAVWTDNYLYNPAAADGKGALVATP